MEERGTEAGRKSGTRRKQGNGSAAMDDDAVEALKLRVAMAQLDFLRLVARGIVQAWAEEEVAAPAAGRAACSKGRCRRAVRPSAEK